MAAPQTTPATRETRDAGSSVPTRPSVSVIVPAYNEALVIEGSLQALYDYMETMREAYDWELVVVDDGSTDDTGEIADRFAATHVDVRVLRHRLVSRPA